MEYIIGQRWVSHADMQLGLGIVVGLEDRRVTLSFPAVGEERTYAAHNAPLTRLRFKREDTVETADGRCFEVTSVVEEKGLLTYAGVDEQGNEHQASEVELDAYVQLTTPQQRLLNGHFDGHAEFALRIATCRQLDRLQKGEARGLLGSRTSLLPHQVYIASEVGQRHAPRVLLADEVGLGKTIEAGMIIHRQLLTGRSERILILVPAPLLHQWLVEMLRRFNLHFALFDEERLQQHEGDNPFETEQLVLASTALFRRSPAARMLALAADWDLVVVDEAHHLQWSEDAPGEDYQFVDNLSRQAAGLLLLTATPEQVGQESHFARLQLLDPARFRDIEQFRQQEAEYRQWSDVIDQLEAGETPSSLPEGLDPTLPAEELIPRILDRHGTGRVLFRNTRASVTGFPERRLETAAIEPPTETGNTDDPLQALYPERYMSDDTWVQTDPRITWLTSTLKALRPAKVLIICSGADTAIALEHYLHLRAGVRSAAFHEGLSIIERDGAAAYFADTENGAQTLVCSEIGSEGRNFQFAQHLVLFDLPLNPDLLEQRIGRLDRIGQRGDISIHVPYFQGTAQETLFRWLHEGLDIFRSSCSAGQMIYAQFSERLLDALGGNGAGFEALLADTRRFTDVTKRELREGRDRLLERNSCRKEEAERLIELIETDESSRDLETYFTGLCDIVGVEYEHHSEHCLILRPGEHMLMPEFPHLDDEGRSVTFDRSIALAREDMAFLTWEHPMVSESMDGILATELGNTAIGTLALKGVAPGSLLLESLFTVNCPAPGQLQLQRFLSLSPVRILVDDKGRDLSALMPHDKLNTLVTRVNRSTGLAIIKQVRSQVEEHLTAATRIAEEQLRRVLSGAREAADATLGHEIERLEALRRINPQVRQDEIDHLSWQREESLRLIDRAGLQLQAVRLIVTR
ncbi:MAG: RNA polymerase-associated protein RapA [Chromatocurvus sp.]